MSQVNRLRASPRSPATADGRRPSRGGRPGARSRRPSRFRPSRSAASGRSRSRSTRRREAAHDGDGLAATAGLLAGDAHDSVADARVARRRCGCSSLGPTPVAVVGGVDEPAVRHERDRSSGGRGRPSAALAILTSDPAAVGIGSAGRTRRVSEVSPVSRPAWRVAKSFAVVLGRRWLWASACRARSAVDLRALGRLPREPHDHRGLRRRDARGHAERRRRGDSRRAHTRCTSTTASASRGPIVRPSRPGRHRSPEDLFFGESPSATHRVNFLPSSTYTWRNDEQPSLVFSFNTSSAPSASSSGSSGSSSGGSSSSGSTSGKSSSSKSKDLVGSSIVPYRGTLSGDVSTTGKLSLMYLGKERSRRSRPAATRCRFSTRHRRPRSSCRSWARRRSKVSGATFVGKHAMTLDAEGRPVVLLLRPGQEDLLHRRALTAAAVSAIPELSRRSFVKGGGALVVGFSLAGSRSRPDARGRRPVRLERAVRPRPGRLVHRDPRRQHGVDQDRPRRARAGLDDRAAAARRRGAGHGRRPARLGQARHQRDAEHRRHVRLELDRDRRPEAPQRGRHGRQALLGLASASLGVPVGGLTVSRGVVSGGGQLRHLRPARRRPALQRGDGRAEHRSGCRAVEADRLVPPGRDRARVPRVDIPAKVTGTYTYLQNVRVPGMLHGRIVRPRGQGAYGDGTANGIVSVDESSIRRIGDARVVRRGDFLGVVASREYDAIEAASKLKVVYRDSARALGQREPLEADARVRLRRAGAGTDPAGHGRRGFGDCVGRALGDRDLRLRLPGPHADRPELRRRRRDSERRGRAREHAGRLPAARPARGDPRACR